jgi:hypothetical protein
MYYEGSAAHLQSRDAMRPRQSDGNLYDMEKI